MYRSFTPELFWSNTSVVVSLFLESVSSSVNTLLLTVFGTGFPKSQRQSIVECFRIEIICVTSRRCDDA